MHAVAFGTPALFQLHEYVTAPRVYVVYTWKDYLAMRQRVYPAAEPVRYSAGKTSKFTFADGSTTYIVGVFNGRRSTLVHELDHLTTMVLADQGVKIDTDDGEPHCYLLEELCALLGIDYEHEEQPCSTRSKLSWLPISLRLKRPSRLGYSRP